MLLVSVCCCNFGGCLCLFVVVEVWILLVLFVLMLLWLRCLLCLLLVVVVLFVDV